MTDFAIIIKSMIKCGVSASFAPKEIEFESNKNESARCIRIPQGGGTIACMPRKSLDHDPGGVGGVVCNRALSVS